MELLIKHFGIIFIIGTIFNGLILKFRSQEYIKENPDLIDGYKKYFYGIITFGNIPWVIMGIGILTGLTDNIFKFFNPRSLNPIVLAFHGSIVFLWILGAYWIYKKQGAEFIVSHPGLFHLSGTSPKNITTKQVKSFYPLFILGGVAAMIMMWSGFIPEI